MAPVAN